MDKPRKKRGPARFAVPAAEALTHARLLELLDYNPDTGVFTWRDRRGKMAAGSVAGNITPAGYRNIILDGRPYSAHRLAWFYVNVCWPKELIDHANRVRDDNRMGNLREANYVDNASNCRRVPNSSGFQGANFDKGLYRVRIYVAGRRVTVGAYKTAEEAGAAYKAAAKLYRGEFASV